MKDSSHLFPLEREQPDLATAIRIQMDRILAHELFSRSQRLSQLLRFTVEKSLSGDAHLLKEYTIGVDVFGRPDAFDPRLDSIVRVQISRLRRKLAIFYDHAGREDPLVIMMPASGYAPRLTVSNLTKLVPAHGCKIGMLDCRKDRANNTGRLYPKSANDLSIVSLNSEQLELTSTSVEFIVIRVDGTTDRAELLRLIEHAVSLSIGVAVVSDLESLGRLWSTRDNLRTAWIETSLGQESSELAS